MDTEKSQFPNGLQALLIVLVLFLAEVVLGATLRDARQFLGLSEHAINPLVVLLANGVVLSVVMHTKRLKYAELFHDTRTSLPATFCLVLLPVLLLVLIISTLVNALSKVMPLSSAEESMFAKMATDNLPNIVWTCILAPVLEEMLFRGVILRSFLSQYSRWEAILLSAILFGFVHLNLYQFFAAFTLGALSGWLYERTRSLIPCIGLHAAYNSSLAFMAFALDAPSGESDSDAFSLAAWTVALLLAAVAIPALRKVLVPRKI